MATTQLEGETEKEKEKEGDVSEVTWIKGDRRKAAISCIFENFLDRDQVGLLCAGVDEERVTSFTEDWKAAKVIIDAEVKQVGGILGVSLIVNRQKFEENFKDFFVDLSYLTGASILGPREFSMIFEEGVE